MNLQKFSSYCSLMLVYPRGMASLVGSSPPLYIYAHSISTVKIIKKYYVKFPLGYVYKAYIKNK